LEVLSNKNPLQQSHEKTPQNHKKKSFTKKTTFKALEGDFMLRKTNRTQQLRRAKYHISL